MTTMTKNSGTQVGLRGRFARAAQVGLFAVTLGACSGLLDVDLPGSATEDALNDPLLAETLVVSVVGDFECGLVDYIRYPGQWFEEFLNTSQSRPDALAGLRSQLTRVYADPCASGTGPLWSPMQVPRQQAKRALSLIAGFDSLTLMVPATTPPRASQKVFLAARARLYEGYAIQHLAEQFCAVTFDGGPLITRAAAYDSAEVKFTEALDSALASISRGVRTAEATTVRNAAWVGRARSRLYQWQYSGGAAADVIADASLVPLGFQLTTTYDATPARRRNRIYEFNNNGGGMMPNRSYTNLRLGTTGLHIQGPAAGGGVGTLDPRVPVFVSAVDDPRGFTKYRLQRKYNSRSAPISFSSWREARLMIAEVDPTQSLAVINQLRTNTAGLNAGIVTNGAGPAAGPTPHPGGPAAQAWPLTQISGATWTALTATQQRDAVREERRRELWMQGHHAGDMIRWGGAWSTTDEYGLQLAAGGCIPVPFLEEIANPNL